MGRLNELFKIQDRIERQKELLEYARVMKVNISRVKNPGGDINEDELAILLYDVEQNKKVESSKNVGIFLGAFFLFSMLMAAIFILTKLLTAGQ